MTLQYPTDCVGNTPLVRLQRLAGDTTNTLLLKLEGNNPAGSVKARNALRLQGGSLWAENTERGLRVHLTLAAASNGNRL